MKITIITVAYNSAATIADTLRSVAAQAHPDIEHIVVDGASTDATLDIVRREGAHLARVVSERDRGIYDAMNKGLALATGDAVGFLNSDDMFAGPGSVAAIAAGFGDGPGVDAVYGDLVFVDPADTARVVRYWRSGAYRRGTARRGWMPPHPTFYARREVLRRSGGFCLDYRLQADFELTLRLLEVEGIASRHIPEVLVRMRMGGATTGSLRNIVRGNLEAARACRSHGFPGGLEFIVAKMGRRIPQFFARPAPGRDASR